MRFHATFQYSAENREKLLQLVDTDALKADSALKVTGAWIAAQTGSAFAVIETDDAKSLYELCSQWSDYGSVHITPVIGIKEL